MSATKARWPLLSQAASYLLSRAVMAGLENVPTVINIPHVSKDRTVACYRLERSIGGLIADPVAGDPRHPTRGALVG